ncbi:hypothetical protein ACGFZL_06410 [Streptomyces sp. NPDC048182]|uniref:hypothetical protein n=1 Tax=Streptomyces sp. NPDC048182 TaxID=3365507 RepID=UPI0037110C08
MLSTGHPNHGEFTVKRRPLPAALALAAVTALVLTACSSEAENSDDNDKIAGADSAGPTATASSGRTAAAVARPTMTLPDDVKEVFSGWRTGDAAKDAVLTDAGHAQTAVTYAVAQGDPKSPALAFYQSGTALAGSQDWVKGIVDADLTYSGTVSYFAPDVSVFDKGTAGVAYCADESKAYNKNRKTQKVDRTPPSEQSYVLYSTRLEKSSDGVWQTTKLASERGSKKCAR